MSRRVDGGALAAFLCLTGCGSRLPADRMPGPAQDGGSQAHDASTASDAGAVGADDYWQVSGTRIVDGAGREVIPRGLGVGELLNIENYFLGVEGDDLGGLGATKLDRALRAAVGDAETERFFAAWRSHVIAAEDVARWQAWGVNSIRLPLNHHALSPARGEYLEAGFAEIDRVVALCKAQGIRVILDLHAAPGAQNTELMSDSLDGVAHLWSEPDLYRAWTVELWGAIAARYADEPAVAGYDLLDEPFEDADTGSFVGDRAKTVLRPFYLDVTEAIRAVDTRHILFVEGGDDWAKGFSGLEPAWDAQLVWTWHKYWDGNDEATLAPFLALRERSQRPLWNGETGEDETAGWSREMVALLEKHGIGWNAWTYKKLAPSDTNPYSIPAPRGWDEMARYLEAFAAGRAPTPPAEALATLDELADNAALARCACNDAWLSDLFGAHCD